MNKRLNRPLSPLEARVLGVLVEKQVAVPDTYPLSVNALVAGCNQKTARNPVIEATEDEVVLALDGLKSLGLAFEGSSSRVPKFEHNAARVLGVPSQALALLTVLMLRGPQTVAELRLSCERLYRFADHSSVEGFLDELANKAEPLVLKLHRLPGAREARWAQLLCGQPVQPLHSGLDESEEALADGPQHSVSVVELSAMKVEQARLLAELALLRTQVAHMANELGLDLPRA